MGTPAFSSAVPARPAYPDSRADRARLTADLLARAAADDLAPADRRELRERVVLVNLAVADAVARRYRNRGVDLDDLRQVAYEGLVKAVGRFDPTQEHDLLAYAVPTISGEIMRYFRDCGWMVRPPRRIQERQRASPWPARS